MKYIRLYSSHSEYEEVEELPDPVVVYDGEHLHWEAGEGEPTDTTYIVE